MNFILVILIVLSNDFNQIDLCDTSDITYESINRIENLVANLSQDLKIIKKSLLENSLDDHLVDIVGYLRIMSLNSTAVVEVDRTNFSSIPVFDSTMQRANDVDMPHRMRHSHHRHSRLRTLMRTEELDLYIQAHCYNDECTYLCIHFARGPSSCANQLIRRVHSQHEHYFLEHYFNARYVGKCCGIGDFVGKPCFTYTPQIGGPAVNCHDEMGVANRYPAP